MLWEIRFTSDQALVSELLPGLLFADLKGDYPTLTPLISVNFPKAALHADPNFKYSPTVRLQGKGPYAVQVGEHVVALSCRKPYSGWSAFGQEIRRLADLLKKTGLLTTIERFSLKYIDMLPAEAPDLGPLAVELKLGGRDLQRDSVHIRVEVQEAGLLHVVQIISLADAVLSETQKVRGLLLDVDTINLVSGGDFWIDFDNLLEKAHIASKDLFFRLLRPETTEALGPEY